MSQTAASNVIRLAQPSAGETVTVPINADNMMLGLGFTPDPNNVAKEGQNLVFSFEDGGKVVLQGYYDHFTNKTLPVMVTDGGDQLPGEQFLASLREDLLTAAGPAAGPAGTPSSGSGEYADDAGSLINGIDRLGSLGTIYWDRQTEVPEEYYNPATLGPGFTPALSITPFNPNDPTDPNDPDDPFKPGLNMAGDRLRMAENQLHDGGTAHQHQDGESNPSGQVYLRVVTNDGLAALIIDGVRYDLVADPSDPNHFTLNLPDLQDQSGVGHLSGGDVYVDGPGAYIVVIDYTLDTNYLGHDEPGIETDEVGSFDFSAVGNSGAASAPTTIHIDVIDDIPIARADAADLGSEAVSIEGNVILGTVNGEEIAGAKDDAVSSSKCNTQSLGIGVF